MNGEWQQGLPPTHGFYLGAWRKGDTLIVSELWFNPDSTGYWWFTRRYTKEYGMGMKATPVKTEVVAWMPMPEPPEEKHEGQMRL